MKLLLGALLAGALGAVAVRRLRPGPPALGGASPAGSVVDPGPGRVAVDVSAFTD